MSGNSDRHGRQKSRDEISEKLLGLRFLCKECKAGAIDFFLGADIGGNGSIMNVKSEGDILHWIITKTDGSTSVIDVDRRNSNKY